MRVLLLLSSLHGGGAERVAVHLLNRLDPQRFAVKMGLLRAAGPYLSEVDPQRLLVAPEGDRTFDFDGPNRAQFAPLKLLRGAFAAPRAFRAMIAEHRPHVVLSFLKGTNLIVWRALSAMGGARPRWIAREGNNVLAVIREEAPCPLAARALTALTRRAYARADRVLAIAEALAADIVSDLALDPARVVAIHNPIDVPAIRRAAAFPVAEVPARPFILAAGRLEVQKGFDILLDAYARSAAPRSHDLVILGQGSLAGELWARATALGIGDRVHWPGFQANPFAWMAAADLFVLSSRWEGFGNVVAEAMAAGAPVLAADCAYGPREIISNQRDGWLTPPEDAAGLGQAIDRLLENPDLRRDLAGRAQESIKRFEVDTIVGRYAALLETVADTAGGPPDSSPFSLSSVPPADLGRLPEPGSHLRPRRC